MAIRTRLRDRACAWRGRSAAAWRIACIYATARRAHVSTAEQRTVPPVRSVRDGGGLQVCSQVEACREVPRQPDACHVDGVPGAAGIQQRAAR